MYALAYGPAWPTYIWFVACMYELVLALINSHILQALHTSLVWMLRDITLAQPVVHERMVLR